MSPNDIDRLLSGLAAIVNDAGTNRGAITSNSDANRTAIIDALTNRRTRAVAITPSDTVALPVTPREIYVGAAGNIALRASGDTADVTLVGVPAGTRLNIEATHIRATGTTAGSLVALL